MPPRKAPSNASASAAAAIGGRDHISNLPDGVLQHMLSFLPAQDVVRTCVLGKRWRHVWKSTTVVRVACGGGTEEAQSMEEIQEFVDHLLCQRIRGDTPLDTCKFDLGEMDEEDMSRVVLWIRIALQCKVRVLQLIVCYACDDPVDDPRDGHPIFISQYLKKLELHGLVDEAMPRRFLDFLYCPILEDLEIVDCFLEYALLISSQSLKRLRIQGCHFHKERVPICAPNLVELELNVSSGKTPSFQRMPSLITASVTINSYSDHDTGESTDDLYSDQSILLHGLSEARSLVLISSDTRMIVFRRDLKFCSSFSKLKSLLLGKYWCEPADFSSLASLLKLCPVLEKLTLQLCSSGPEYKVEIKLDRNPLELSPEVSRHLKIVEVKWNFCDERVSNVLIFLTKQIFQQRQGCA